jgi:hypothetical protein
VFFNILFIATSLMSSVVLLSFRVFLGEGTSTRGRCLSALGEGECIELGLLSVLSNFAFVLCLFAGRRGGSSSTSAESSSDALPLLRTCFVE